MSNGVLDKVSDRIANGIAVPLHDDRFRIGLQRNGSFASERPWRHRGHDFGGNIVEVNRVGYVQRHGVEPGNAQQLIHKAVHPLYIGFYLGYLAVPIDDIERGGDDGKRCAQLMGRICSELTLKVEALLESIQCAIDRGVKAATAIAVAAT